jgi:hypothetical protein
LEAHQSGLPITASTTHRHRDNTQNNEGDNDSKFNDYEDELDDNNNSEDIDPSPPHSRLPSPAHLSLSPVSITWFTPPTATVLTWTPAPIPITTTSPTAVQPISPVNRDFHNSAVISATSHVNTVPDIDTNTEGLQLLNALV